jgi:vanillate O-demethylase ferredoxin subunit
MRDGLTVVVASRRDEAAGIVALELALADGGPLPAFEPGSHIDVELGTGLIRQYSLVGDCRRRDRYVIGVLRDPGSRGGSTAVHELLLTGREVRISEPRNNFPLDEGAVRTLLFGGGIGITPLLCMAERLVERGKTFELHYAARSSDAVAFRTCLQRSDMAPSVHVHLDDGPDQQRIDPDRDIGTFAAGQHLYVCGPGGLIDFILDSARRRGWPDEALHREYFTAAPIKAESDAGFTIRLARDGRDLHVAPHETVAEVLVAAGIDLPMSCEQGVCGTCLTRVIEGMPDHRDLFLSDAEHLANREFTPCCSRSLTPVLVLDL